MSDDLYNSYRLPGPPIWQEPDASVSQEDELDAARQQEADWLATNPEFNKLSDAFKQIIYSSPTATDDFYFILHDLGGKVLGLEDHTTAWNDGKNLHVPPGVWKGGTASPGDLDATFHEMGHLVTTKVYSSQFPNDPYGYAVARAQGEVNAQFHAVMIEREIGGWANYGIPMGGFGYQIAASDWQRVLLRGMSVEDYHSFTNTVLVSNVSVVPGISDLNGDGKTTHLDQYLAAWVGVGGMGFSKWVAQP